MYAKRASGLLVPHLPARSLATTGSSAKLASKGPWQRTDVNYLSKFPQTRITQLPNGLRVATEQSGGQSGNGAAVGIFMNTGSRYESDEDCGVAHFLEHMHFKGTNKRSRVELERDIENAGTLLNAYTAREQTSYHAKCFEKDVGTNVELIADMLLNAKLSDAAVEEEKGVILREAQEVEKNFYEVVMDRLHATAYGHSALGRLILGTTDNINRINSGQLKKYVQSHYIAPRMIVSASGNVDHDELVRHVEKNLGSVPSEPANGIEPRLTPAIFTGKEYRERQDGLEEAHIAYAFPTAGWNDPDTITLMVINSMLGSWDQNVSGGEFNSSQLVSEVAANGLARQLQTFHTIYSDTGLFGVYAVSKPTNLDNLMWNITNAMSTLSRDVDPFVLEMAKNTTKTLIVSTLDNTQAHQQDVAMHLAQYGRRISPAEMIARIDSVDANAIKQCAYRYFIDRDFAMAAIGPIYELPDYGWLRNRTYLSRF